MTVQFRQGRFLRDEDLNTFFYSSNLPFSPVYIRYEYGYNHPTDGYHRIGSLNRIPIELNIGQFRPNFIIGDRAQVGSYSLIWKFKISDFSDIETRTEFFDIITEGLYENTFREEGAFDLSASLNVLIEGSFDIPGDLIVLIEAYFDLPGDMVAEL